MTVLLPFCDPNCIIALLRYCVYITPFFVYPNYFDSRSSKIDCVLYSILRESLLCFFRVSNWTLLVWLLWLILLLV